MVYLNGTECVMVIGKVSKLGRNWDGIVDRMRLYVGSECVLNGTEWVLELGRIGTEWDGFGTDWGWYVMGCG